MNIQHCLQSLLLACCPVATYCATQSADTLKAVHLHDVTIQGRYHIMVYCTDAAGNQSVVAREIVLSHDAPEHEE